MRRLVGVFIAVLVLVSSDGVAGAARTKGPEGGAGKETGNSSFAWNLYDLSIMNPIEQWVEWPFPEQDRWVVNTAAGVSPPGPCAWDVDDHWYLIAMGTINAGASVVTDHCRVADPNPIWQVRNGTEAWWNYNRRYMGVRVQSPSPDLAVSVSYTPQGRTFTLQPVYDAATREYVYRGCVGLSYHPNDPAWPYERDPAVQPVPGSNGGWGVITHAAVSVTNASSRKVGATAKLEELAAWTSSTTVSTYCSANR
ncbi:MAG: hypothetical protein ACRD0N_01705, partial [Acidimicrobiales bacterium]